MARRACLGRGGSSCGCAVRWPWPAGSGVSIVPAPSRACAIEAYL